MSPSLIKWDRVGFPIKALNDHRVRKSKKSCLTGPDLFNVREKLILLVIFSLTEGMINLSTYST